MRFGVRASVGQVARIGEQPQRASLAINAGESVRAAPPNSTVARCASKSGPLIPDAVVVKRIRHRKMVLYCARVGTPRGEIPKQNAKGNKFTGTPTNFLAL
jgi:hypothetical protein